MFGRVGLGFIWGWFRVYLYCASWGLFRFEKRKSRKQQGSRTVKKQRSKEAEEGKKKKGKSREAEQQRSKADRKISWEKTPYVCVWMLLDVYGWIWMRMNAYGWVWMCIMDVYYGCVWMCMDMLIYCSDVWMYVCTCVRTYVRRHACMHWCICNVTQHNVTLRYVRQCMKCT